VCCEWRQGCQGRGIYLTRTYENVSSTEPLVVQRYLTDPYLIEGLKFDLRVYIVVTSCDPLRVYMFKVGRVVTRDGNGVQAPLSLYTPA
jgi:tubulin polyglutamylase TTLL6/13